MPRLAPLDTVTGVPYPSGGSSGATPWGAPGNCSIPFWSATYDVRTWSNCYSVAANTCLPEGARSEMWFGCVGKMRAAGA